MKAVWYERKGAARDVLTYGERPVPEPGPGEVRVKLVVSGLNPSDLKGRSGWRGAVAERPAGLALRGAARPRLRHRGGIRGRAGRACGAVARGRRVRDRRR